jgi:hypothetical protein
MVPNLAPAPSRPATRPQQHSHAHLHNLRKIPSTLGQLSGTGGLASDAINGFGGFDPVTGIANGVVSSSRNELTSDQYGNINPQFFAAYNAAVTAVNTPNSSTPSSTPAPSETSTSAERRVLNPLAPPFMLFHPVQLAYPPSLPHSVPVLNRQQPQENSTPQPVPVLQTWYPHPPPSTSGPATERTPFPSVPPPPADFASPIPLGPMVAVQSLFGFPTPTAENGHISQGICWDPVVGMFRAAGSSAVSATGVFEQVVAPSEGAANAA